MTAEVSSLCQGHKGGNSEGGAQVFAAMTCKNMFYYSQEFEENVTLGFCLEKGNP